MSEREELEKRLQKLEAASMEFADALLKSTKKTIDEVDPTTKAAFSIRLMEILKKPVDEKINPENV